MYRGAARGAIEQSSVGEDVSLSTGTEGAGAPKELQSSLRHHVGPDSDHEKPGSAPFRKRTRGLTRDFSLHEGRRPRFSRRCRANLSQFRRCTLVPPAALHGSWGTPHTPRGPPWDPPRDSNGSFGGAKPRNGYLRRATGSERSSVVGVRTQTCPLFKSGQSRTPSCQELWIPPGPAKLLLAGEERTK